MALRTLVGLRLRGAGYDDPDNAYGYEYKYTNGVGGGYGKEVANSGGHRSGG
jgi:hypothetical protein